jgi:ATP-dependent Clp protease adaptor protein ClpS
MFDFSMSGSSEWLAAIAVLAVAGGFLLGYSLVGMRTRAQEHPEPAPEDTGEPRYAVVLHNDDFNTFGFVIGVLGEVFAYGGLLGFWLALKVHCTGRGVMWSGTPEVAELKAEQVRSCGADPKGRLGVQPLKVTVEPLPG